MSILFGICQPKGQVVEERELIELSQGTGRFAPDGTFVRAIGRIGMGFQPYHTHLRSKLESLPKVGTQGNMLTLDGRLDNYLELCELLELPRDKTADSAIILAAFERWGEDCFSRFVGDWALALWSNADRTFYLARDHAGMRTLYFEQIAGSILWSTYLETFFVESKRREPDAVYAACYLACEPIGDLTPYRGISAVTPAHYLVCRNGTIARRAHWRWMAKDKIRYQTGAEYQEHFLTLFRQSVNRRTGPGAPILAELSGGMDSSSIVCMSDHMRKQQGATPEDLLDTVSYYDESDSGWNEAPYFSCVERERRKRGLHLPLPLLSDDLLPSPVPDLLPGADLATYANERRFDEETHSNGYRIVLSGIGGDELLGGVPTPFPELADHLAFGHLRSFAKRAVPWCLHLRRPLFHLSAATVTFLLDQYFKPNILNMRLPPWSTPSMNELVQKARSYSADRGHFFGFAPSSIGNGRTWWATIETLPHLHPGSIRRLEYRYPYLDRDLVDFLLRVPREQLLQPGRRRSLMRSALQGITPTEILERRRKGARHRAIFVPLRNGTARIRILLNHSRTAALGIVNATELADTVVQAIHANDPIWIHAVTRLVLFELWCEGSSSMGVAPGSTQSEFVA
jgi:asparagine synthase (glutamine-hydrolysing)